MLGRHVQRQAPPPSLPSQAQSGGVDYLSIVEHQHLHDSIGRLSYRHLEQEDTDS